MIAQTPVRVLCGTIARCKTPFSNRVLHAVPPRSLQSYKDSKSLGKKGYSEIMVKMSQKASATLQRQSFVRQKSSFPDKPMILQSFSGRMPFRWTF